VTTTLADVGLGYLTLGQQSPTLSGGEAQRIKLVTELAKVLADVRAGPRQKPKHTLYVLDEPTVGLHMADVEQLLVVLHRLVDAGNTAVVVEHNLDVIKTADWIVDLGPEGGDRGGSLVIEGTPEEVAVCSHSHTGIYLRDVLSGERKPAAHRVAAEGEAGRRRSRYVLDHRAQAHRLLRRGRPVAAKIGREHHAPAAGSLEDGLPTGPGMREAVQKDERKRHLSSDYDRR